MATMKTLNGYGFNATELNGKTSDNYLKKTDTASNSAKLGGKTLAEIMLALYPVGAVYISANSTSPASLFGGTWESIGGRFLLGADATYAAGSTGGEATHTLTIGEMPSHNHNHPNGAHTFFWSNKNGDTYINANVIAEVSSTKPGTVAGTNNFTNYSGSGTPHNNMPPYLTVYMWKRVS